MTELRGRRLPPRLPAADPRGLLSLVATSAALLSVCLLAGCASGSGAASPSTPTAYVATGANMVNPGSTVSVVDTLTSTAQSPIATGTLPSGLGVTPDGKYVLVTNKGDDTVAEVDVASGAVVKRVTVGLEPDAVSVTPDGSQALVANFGDDTVTPLRLPSLTAGRPIVVGHQPVAVAVSPEGTLALVINYQDGTLSPIDLSSLTAGPPVAAGTQPDSVYITPDGHTALVGDFGANAVVSIQLPSLAPGPAIPVGGNPTGIAGLGSATAYISGSSSVIPLSLETDRVGVPIDIGTTAEGLAMSRNGATAWVCGGDGTLVHVDLSKRSVIGRVVIGGHPSAVVIADPRRSTG